MLVLFVGRWCKVLPVIPYKGWMLRRSLVNLDCLINLGQVCVTKKRDPVNIIESMLNASPKVSRAKRPPVRFSPQRFVVVKKPSGICPKCKVFVKDSDDGVVCGKCVAFWHFQCAGVTQEILDQEWKNIDFLCVKHRDEIDSSSENNAVHLVGGVSQSALVENIDTIFSGIKIHAYKLNVREKLKQKLEDMNRESTCVENDGGRQHTLKLNSMTYQLIVDNMLSLGSQLGGVDVKRNDVDNEGAHVQCQYAVDIGNGITISVTCYNTTSNILIQLMGKVKMSERDEKIAKLQTFMGTQFKNLIRKIESAQQFIESKAAFKSMLENELSAKSYGSKSRKECNSSSSLNVIDECVSAESVGANSGVPVEFVDVVNECNDASCVVDIDTVSGQETVVDGGTTQQQIVVSSKVTAVVKENTNSNSDNACVTHKPVNEIKADECLAVVKKGSSSFSRKKMTQSFSILNKDKKMSVGRDDLLFNVILKLKEKGEQMKDQMLMSYCPSANDRISKLTLQLINGQKEIEKLKSKNKDLENQVNDLKKSKSEWEREKKELLKKESEVSDADARNLKNSGDMENLRAEVESRDQEIAILRAESDTLAARIDDLVKEMGSKDDQIVGYRKINEELRDDLAKSGMMVKKISEEKVELENKYKVMVAVAGEVKDDRNENLVILTDKTDSDAELRNEMAFLNHKLDETNKKNSLLKDDLEVKSRSLERMDNFYKEILDQKDETLKSYLSIIEGDKDEAMKMKRLLIKFRAEQELKVVQDLMRALETSEGEGAAADEGNVDDGDKSSAKKNLTVVGFTGSGAGNHVNNNNNKPIANSLRRSGDDDSVNIDNNKPIETPVLLNGGGIENNVNADETGEEEINNEKKGLCRDGRLCSDMIHCKFRHELVRKHCRFGVRCNRKNKCLFLHQLDRNYDVDNDHSNSCSHRQDMDYAEQQYGRRDDGHWHSNRYEDFRAIEEAEYYGGNGDHRQIEQNGSGRRLCRNGQTCKVPGCDLYHIPVPRQCRYGMNCSHKTTTCLFQHGNNKTNDSSSSTYNRGMSSEEQNVWLRSKN